MDAAQAGAEAIKAVLDNESLVVHDKGSRGQDFVTNADLASESAIIDVIKARRGHDAILTEEAGEVAGTSGVRWVIDPLDGTTNLTHGGTYFAVSIAAELHGQVVAAVVCQPGSGARLAWGPDGVASGGRVGVRSCRSSAGALVSFAVPYDAQQRRAAYRALSDVAPRVHDLRNLGSTACDLSAVATGDLDGFIGFGQKPWDTAAGLALVVAAGGTSRIVRRPDGMEVVIAGSSSLVSATSSWHV